MPKFYFQKLSSRFLYPELLLNFIAIIVLAFGHESIFLSAGIILFLCIHSIMLWVKAGTSKAYKGLRHHKHVSEQRIKLIREIIKLSMYYEGYSKEWLYKKFCELVNIDKLLHSSVLDIDKEIKKLYGSGKAKNLSKDELHFYCLMKAGFTMRELSILFDIKSHKYAYVKKKRIEEKMDANVNQTSTFSASDTKETSISAENMQVNA